MIAQLFKPENRRRAFLYENQLYTPVRISERRNDPLFIRCLIEFLYRPYFSILFRMAADFPGPGALFLHNHLLFPSIPLVQYQIHEYVYAFASEPAHNGN